MRNRKLAALVTAIAATWWLVPAGAQGDDPAPRIRITNPDAAAQTIEQNEVVRGRASDDGRVLSVRISVDEGRFADATCPCPRAALRWRYVLPELSFGNHELTVMAVDDLHQSRVVTRSFTIDQPDAIYRAFTVDSWWNTPFPADAPRDPDSRRFIRALVRETNRAPLRLTGLPSSFPQAQPVYFAKEADPFYTIRPLHGPKVTIHIPRWSIPSGAENPKMTVIDTATDQGVGLAGVRFTGERWTANGVDRYLLSSEGIAEDAGGTRGNSGHRGATMVLKALRLEEVLLGPIAHRAECFVPPTLTGTKPVWPMTGSDGDLPDGIPEGIVLRIRPSVDLAGLGLSRYALVVATLLQDYGCLVSDGGAPHAATLRLARADWSSTRLKPTSFASIGWDDWEFVQGGYRP